MEIGTEEAEVRELGPDLDKTEGRGWAVGGARELLRMPVLLGLFLLLLVLLLLLLSLFGSLLFSFDEGRLLREGLADEFAILFGVGTKFHHPFAVEFADLPHALQLGIHRIDWLVGCAHEYFAAIFCSVPQQRFTCIRTALAEIPISLPSSS